MACGTTVANRVMHRGIAQVWAWPLAKNSTEIVAETGSDSHVFQVTATIYDLFEGAWIGVRECGPCGYPIIVSYLTFQESTLFTTFSTSAAIYVDKYDVNAAILQ